MSLLVTVCRRDNECEMASIEFSPGEDLAGPEAWRKTFYGSTWSIELGAKILPNLATADICVHGPDLQVLKKDVYKLLANLRSFPGASKQHRGRVHNILIAVEKAQGEPGLWVCID